MAEKKAKAMIEKPNELFSTAAHSLPCSLAWTDLSDKEKWQKYGVAPFNSSAINFNQPGLGALNS